MYIRIEGRELKEWGGESGLIISTIKKIIKQIGISHWYMEEMADSEPSDKYIVNEDWEKLYFYFN